ncbi:unnamed protein product [Albugo candida]|uniref:PIPK domain-containing protein n=1 Tax=Albugo candida TaxID=65357 RepID=A0A024G3J2_9STRA|nr:unnamed protein product [Albugo candida]|eukprot:CCI41383.1 unnamed protein product [Albugo candida]
MDLPVTTSSRINNYQLRYMQAEKSDETSMEDSFTEKTSRITADSTSCPRSMQRLQDSHLPCNTDTSSSNTPSFHQWGLPSQSTGRLRAMLGLQNCFLSSTRLFQLIMFLAFVIALMMSLTQQYRNLSPGIIWGAILSAFSVSFVILSYISVRSYRQHPNPLVFWRTIADAFFVVQLSAQQFIQCLFYDCVPLCNPDTWQCGCALASNAGQACSVFAGFFEFSLIAAECWFLCMTLNLLMSLTNPFTDFKRNTRFFHIFCWGMGLIFGGLLATTDDWAGYSDLGICWTNAFRNLPTDRPSTCAINSKVIDNFPSDYKAGNANFISWAFFYIWMAIIIVLGIAVWLWACNRLSDGMSETYAVRVQSINRARFIVFAVTFYWIVTGIVYIKFLSHKIIHRDRFTRELLNFLIAGKGYVDLVIWFVLNDFRWSHFTKSIKESVFESEIDLSPAVNAALRQEVLYYTTSGMVQAVQTAHHLARTERVQQLALLPQTLEGEPGKSADKKENPSKHTKTFHDYEPHTFKRIRERFGVTNETYLRSLSSTAKERLSEGASGAFMFFSADGGLIVKSMSKEECDFLRQIAQEYAEYLCTHPTSLLTRFYGCHCLELYRKNFYFVVMANLFDIDHVIHYRYDIKGSWVNRNADLPKKGKRVTCRHCNRKYTYMSNACANDIVCPERLNSHEPNVVLKDPDLTQKLKLNGDESRRLYQQLCADSELLCSFGIMDYSLLMGVHEHEYMVDDALDDDAANDTTKNTQKDDSDHRKQNANTTGNERVRGKGRVSTYLSTQSKGEGMQHRRLKAPSRRSRDLECAYPASSSRRQMPRGGMRLANTVVGPAYYHLGVIDILQTWTLKKRMERLFKIVVKRVDGDGLSALEPNLYKVRFQSKMADILGIESSIEPGSSPFIQQSMHMDIDVPESDSIPLPAHSLPPSDVLSGQMNDEIIMQRSSVAILEEINSSISSNLRAGKKTSKDLSMEPVRQYEGDYASSYEGIDYHL